MLSNYFSALKMFYFESDFINALEREGVDSLPFAAQVMDGVILILEQLVFLMF